MMDERTNRWANIRIFIPGYVSAVIFTVIVLKMMESGAGMLLALPGAGFVAGLFWWRFYLSYWARFRYGLLIGAGVLLTAAILYPSAFVYFYLLLLFAPLALVLPWMGLVTAMSFVLKANGKSFNPD